MVYIVRENGSEIFYFYCCFKKFDSRNIKISKNLILVFTIPPHHGARYYQQKEGSGG